MLIALRFNTFNLVLLPTAISFNQNRIVLNVAIMAIYLFVYNRLFDAYKELDNTDSNAAYLKN
jgi:hypothetical protein